MSLLRPTPGEMLDRLSILDLKIKAYHEAGRDSHQLCVERNELLERLKATKKRKGFGVSSACARLMEVNSDLWECETRIRERISEASAGVIGKRIAELNDLRNETIRKLDRAYGCETPVEEKVYVLDQGD